MRGHLLAHLDEWAADSWGGRSSPSPPVSAASSPSTSRASSPTPGSSAAATAAATPKLFLPLPPQNLAYVKELEQKVKDLEREKKRVAGAARKKVDRRDKEVDKQKGLLSKEREQHAHTREEAAHFNNEASEAKEALEEWIAQNQDDPQVKNCNELVGELETFKGGQYTTTVRLIYMQLIRDRVSVDTIRNTVSTILTLAGVEHGRLPGRTTAQFMRAEMAVLADQEAGATLAAQPDGSVAMAGDEATKLGKSRFALGMFFADSIGDPVIFAALGVIDAMGGTAEKPKEAIVDLLEWIAMNHTLMKK